MRIGMVGFHGCIRVFKESRALMLRGHQVELTVNYQFQPFGMGKYDRISHFAHAEQLATDIRSSKADLFHVHNEPDWMVAVVKESASGRPVVYDVHDLESLRWQREPDEHERAAFEAADAVVHVSQACKDAADRYHGDGKPGIILFPYVNKEFYGQAASVNWSSLVYEGGLTSEPVRTNQGELNYRSYQDVVRAFLENGFQVHLYGAGGRNGDEVYEQLGAFVTRDQFYPQLMIAMRVHGFGLVGAPESNPLMEAAMPNKLFEYIAAGVVPVCYNAESAAQFCEQHGVGIRLPGLDDFNALYGAPQVREQLLSVRDQFAMEAHIHELEALYQQL